MRLTVYQYHCDNCQTGLVNLRIKEGKYTPNMTIKKCNKCNKSFEFFEINTLKQAGSQTITKNTTNTVSTIFGGSI